MDKDFIVGIFCCIFSIALLPISYLLFIGFYEILYFLVPAVIILGVVGYFYDELTWKDKATEAILEAEEKTKYQKSPEHALQEARLGFLKGLETEEPDYDKSNGYKAQATSFKNQGFLQKAIKYYVKSVKLNSENWGSWLGLGNLYLRMGLPIEAMEAFKKVLSAEFNNKDAHAGISKATKVHERSSLIRFDRYNALQYLKCCKCGSRQDLSWFGFTKTYKDLVGSAGSKVIYTKGIDSVSVPVCPQCRPIGKKKLRGVNIWFVDHTPQIKIILNESIKLYYSQWINMVLFETLDVQDAGSGTYTPQQSNWPKICLNCGMVNGSNVTSCGACGGDL